MLCKNQDLQWAEFVQVLLEDGSRCKRDLLGETPMKDKRRRNRSRKEEPSDYDVGLTPEKGEGRKEDSVARASDAAQL